MPEYYDGTKLLSLRDLTGQPPEIIMCTGNRTGGKTTFFSRMLVNHHLKLNSEFLLLYRFQTELSNISASFFNDIKRLFFRGHEMTHKVMAKGKYVLLFLDERVCGYATALTSADFIKRNSHLFTNVKEIFVDEFQSEANVYAPGELVKFHSIHTSIARGNGEQYRFVPVYMCSNCVSLLNPYFTVFGVAKRLQKDTKFLRGDGWVLEQALNESAKQAQETSAFNRAFAGEKFVAYANQNVYLNDNLSFIEKMTGKSRYVCTIRYKGKFYSIKEFQKEGVVYVDTSYDLSYPLKLSLTTEDHNVNYIMLQNSMELILRLRYYFNNGCFRFRNLEAKEMLLVMLSY